MRRLRTTSVSAPTTIAPGVRLATAYAFAAAAQATWRNGPSGAGGDSSIPGATARNATPDCVRISIRLGDVDASTMGRTKTSRRSETEQAQQQGGRDTAGDRHGGNGPSEWRARPLGRWRQRVAGEQRRQLQPGEDERRQHA